jgi:hypothetical protein
MAIKFLWGDMGIVSGEYGRGVYTYGSPFEDPENGNLIKAVREIDFDYAPLSGENDNKIFALMDSL